MNKKTSVICSLLCLCVLSLQGADSEKQDLATESSLANVQDWRDPLKGKVLFTSLKGEKFEASDDMHVEVKIEAVSGKVKIRGRGYYKKGCEYSQSEERDEPFKEGIFGFEKFYDDNVSAVKALRELLTKNTNHLGVLRGDLNFQQNNLQIILNMKGKKLERLRLGQLPFDGDSKLEVVKRAITVFEEKQESWNMGLLKQGFYMVALIELRGKE